MVSEWMPSPDAHGEVGIMEGLEIRGTGLYIRPWMILLTADSRRTGR